MGLAPRQHERHEPLIQLGSTRPRPCARRAWSDGVQEHARASLRIGRVELDVLIVHAGLKPCVEEVEGIDEKRRIDVARVPMHQARDSAFVLSIQ